MYKFLIVLLLIANYNYASALRTKRQGNEEGKTPNLLMHKNINMLAPLDKCGEHVTSDRLLFGNTTQINEYPWTALLEYKNKATGKSVGHSCGGVLIGPKYILTAAHCVVGAISKAVGDLYRVRLGEYNKSTSPIDCIDDLGEKICNMPMQDIEVEEVIAHPEYIDGDSNRYHDIAIVRLARPAEYNEYVKPICMPLKGESRAAGQSVEVAGWGTGTKISSPVKLQGTLNIVANNECAKIYSSNFDVQIHDKHVCARGDGNLDACILDGGGALTTPTLQATDYVEGISSFGPRTCGTPGIPEVYTRVASYSEWILDNIRQ